jgi:cell wall-associated NlpC family hydrolase
LIAWDPWLEPTIVVTDKWVRAWEDPNGLRASLLAFALGTRLKAIDIAGQLWRVELLNGAAVWIPHQAACSLKSLRGLSPREKRQAILRMAEVFLNDAYSWGGRSPAASSPAGKAADAPQGQDRATGVDCSGLTNLAYRAAGIDIPRDAHEQHLRARPVTTLEPADLIFLSERGNPQRIVHVMLYAGDGQLMEGPGTGTAVRRITVQERLGRPLDRLASGTVIEEQTVRFGSYLP